MPNPLVQQGSLIRIRGSVTIPSNPSLNVTSSFMTKEGIRLSFQGEANKWLETMTGAVTSPEVKMMAEVTMNIVRTTPLANLYKQTMETNVLLGDITVRTDATQLGVYSIVNGGIRSVQPMDFAGENPAWTVVLGGYYLVNSFLFDIT